MNPTATAAPSGRRATPAGGPVAASPYLASPVARNARASRAAPHRRFTGWTLVGDAGYNRDPITGLGIQDAFRDAELCARALAESWSGARSYEAAMDDYQSARDQTVLPTYELTCQIALLEPPPPEMQQLLGAVHGNQEAMDDFVLVNTGALSPTQFFSDESVGRIFAAAGGVPGPV